MKNKHKLIYSLFVALGIGLSTFCCSDTNIEPKDDSPVVTTPGLPDNGTPTSPIQKGSVLALANQICNGADHSSYFGAYLQMAMGVTFKANRAGSITHVGEITALTKGSIVIRIWDPQAPASPIRTTTITVDKSTPGASYVPLATPLPLTAGKEYIISVTRPTGGYALAPASAPNFLPSTIGDITIINGVTNFYYRSATKTFSDYPGDGLVSTNQIMGYPDFIFVAE